MKHLTAIAAFAAAAIVLSSCGEATTGDAAKDTAAAPATAAATTPDAAAPPMDSAAQMKAWMDYMTPGPQHGILAGAEGKWKTESTMWMEPGAPPQTSTGEAVIKMMLGGRYQRMTFNGSMMGQPMEGEGTVAFDNAKKMFVSTWVDNMGTGIMQMEGPWDEATKSMTLKGSYKDPMTGKECSMREVYTMTDNRHHVMEMYSTTDGKEYKNMEMKLTKL